MPKDKRLAHEKIDTERYPFVDLHGAKEKPTSYKRP